MFTHLKLSSTFRYQTSDVISLSYSVPRLCPLIIATATLSGEEFGKIQGTSGRGNPRRWWIYSDTFKRLPSSLNDWQRKRCFGRKSSANFEGNVTIWYVHNWILGITIVFVGSITSADGSRASLLRPCAAITGGQGKLTYFMYFPWLPGRGRSISV